MYGIGYMPPRKKAPTKKEDVILVSLPIAADKLNEGTKTQPYDPQKFEPSAYTPDWVSNAHGEQLYEPTFFGTAEWTAASNMESGTNLDIENHDILPEPQNCINREPLPQVNYRDLVNDAINSGACTATQVIDAFDKNGNKLMLPEFSARSDDLPPAVHGSCCWWDCHAFSGVPAVIPLRLRISSLVTDDVRPRATIYVYGCFCSWNCAYAYYLHDPQKFKHDVPMLMKFMYKKLHNGEQLVLKPAPNRLLLNMFGGIFTIEQFRSEFIRNKNFKIHDLRIISSIALYDCKINLFDKITSRDQSNEVVVDTSNTEKTDKSTLVVKRNKPLKRDKNTLDSCFANFFT